MKRGESVASLISAQLFVGFGRIFKGSKRGDHFRFVATAIVTLFLFFAASLPAHADLDLSIGATARSYPLSGVVETELGYGEVIWGDASGSPFYGYLRSRVEGSSSVTYNSGDVALEFFPLSFIGARVGGESIQNDQNYTAYDCASVRCRGRFYRDYVEAELSLGAGSMFLHGSWRRERWSEPRAQAADELDFVDPTSGLLMRRTGDSQTVYFGVVGWKLSPEWAVLGILRYAQSDPRDFSRMPIAAIRYHADGLTLNLGTGCFESTLKGQSVTVMGSIRFDLFPSVALQ